MPTALLALGISLRPEHPPAQREHIAHLGGRLGFVRVWLPAGGAARWPAPAELAALAARAAPAGVGLVLDDGPDPDELSVLVAEPTVPEFAVELDPPAAADRAALVAALGGPDGWRRRAHVRAVDPGAAACVVSSARSALPDSGREALLGAVRAAARTRSAAGRSALDLPITVALTVSIGRTMNEAAARAERDPALSGAAHPGRAGLFGTLEDAQRQALALRRAGADAVRASLADERDVADLLAQLRSVAVGPTPVLHARGR